MAQSGRDESRKLPARDTIQKIISQEDPETLVQSAKVIGQALAFQATSSQIRNIFGTARQIDLRWENDPVGAYRDAVLLRPKIGYMAKRERGRGMADDAGSWLGLCCSRVPAQRGVLRPRRSTSRGLVRRNRVHGCQLGDRLSAGHPWRPLTLVSGGRV